MEYNILIPFFLIFGYTRASILCSQTNEVKNVDTCFGIEFKSKR
jgi:hypothetical protein